MGGARFKPQALAWAGRKVRTFRVLRMRASERASEAATNCVWWYVPCPKNVRRVRLAGCLVSIYTYCTVVVGPFKVMPVNERLGCVEQVAYGMD